MSTSRSSLVAMKDTGGETPAQKAARLSKEAKIASQKSNQKPVITTELNGDETKEMAMRLIKTGMKGGGMIWDELQANKNNPFYTSKQQTLKTPTGNKDTNITVDYRNKLNNWLPEQTSVMLQKAKAKGLNTPESIEANKEYLMGNDDKGNAMRHEMFNQNFPDYWDKFKLLAKTNNTPVIKQKPTPSSTTLAVK